MNQFNKNKQEFIDDELKAFLIPEESEQAPAGFTVKIMELIKKEPLPVVEKKEKFRFATVPVIYGAVLTALIIIALLIPNTENDAVNGFSWLQTLYSFIPEIPKIEFEISLTTIIPKTLTYIMIGCLGLFIFDSVLFKYFNRRNELIT